MRKAKLSSAALPSAGTFGAATARIAQLWAPPTATALAVPWTDAGGVA